VNLRNKLHACCICLICEYTNKSLNSHGCRSLCVFNDTGFYSRSSLLIQLLFSSAVKLHPTSSAVYFHLWNSSIRATCLDERLRCIYEQVAAWISWVKELRSLLAGYFSVCSSSYGSSTSHLLCLERCKNLDCALFWCALPSSVQGHRGRCLWTCGAACMRGHLSLCGSHFFWLLLVTLKYSLLPLLFQPQLSGTRELVCIRNVCLPVFYLNTFGSSWVTLTYSCFLIQCLSDLAHCSAALPQNLTGACSRVLNAECLWYIRNVTSSLVSSASQSTDGQSTNEKWIFLFSMRLFC